MRASASCLVGVRASAAAAFIADRRSTSTAGHSCCRCRCVCCSFCFRLQQLLLPMLLPLRLLLPQLLLLRLLLTLQLPLLRLLLPLLLPSDLLPRQVALPRSRSRRPCRLRHRGPRLGLRCLPTQLCRRPLRLLGGAGDE